MKFLKHITLAATVMMITPLAWSMREDPEIGGGSSPEDEAVILLRDLNKDLERMCMDPLPCSNPSYPSAELLGCTDRFKTPRYINDLEKAELNKSLEQTTLTTHVLLTTIAMCGILKVRPKWLGEKFSQYVLPQNEYSDLIKHYLGGIMGRKRSGKILDWSVTNFIKSRLQEMKNKVFTVSLPYKWRPHKDSPYKEYEQYAANPSAVYALLSEVETGEPVGPFLIKKAYVRMIANQLLFALTNRGVFNYIKALGECISFSSPILLYNRTEKYFCLTATASSVKAIDPDTYFRPPLFWDACFKPPISQNPYVTRSAGEILIPPIPSELSKEESQKILESPGTSPLIWLLHANNDPGLTVVLPKWVKPPSLMDSFTGLITSPLTSIWNVIKFKSSQTPPEAETKKDD